MGAYAATGDEHRTLIARSSANDGPACEPLTLSVVICTWNRADMLADTIGSLFACNREEGLALQVIVVDNASTDHTAILLTELEREYGFERAFEPRSGLSIARNTGVERARGEWVIFLDDDVLLPETFLVNYARAIRSLPEPGFIAGGVIPHFDGIVPEWVTALCREEWWCFSAMLLEAPTGQLTAAQSPYGANMAVRRDILDTFRFSDDLGFRHGVLIPGEETELFARIRAAGHLGYWVDNVSLRHRLPAKRWQLAYLVKRAWGQGQADAHSAKGSRARFPMWILREIAESSGRLLVQFMARRPTWACSLIRVVRQSGQLSARSKHREAAQEA